MDHDTENPEILMAATSTPAIDALLTTSLAAEALTDLQWETRLKYESGPRRADFFADKQAGTVRAAARRGLVTIVQELEGRIYFDVTDAGLARACELETV